MTSSRRRLLAALATTGATLVAGCGATGLAPDATDDASAEGETATATTGSERETTATTSTTGNEDAYVVEGGPNVVDAVPADADHVVDVASVAFDPDDLTVAVGDTVAFEHVDGGAHSVTATADGIPDDADYWASGGFDSQDAAEAGYEDTEGVVSAGTTYVHTFETAGTHAYYCIPHERLQMNGVVRVEP